MEGEGQTKGDDDDDDAMQSKYMLPVPKLRLPQAAALPIPLRR